MTEVTERAHAKLSASGAHRWMNCPGSVAAEEPYPESTSVFADEGTLAHGICELALSENSTARLASYVVTPRYLGLDLSDDVVDDAFLDACQTYIDYVNAQPGAQRFYEVRVDFSQWVPEGFGTSDVVILDGNTIRIIDLKFGKGVKVDAEDNPQPLLYALGVFNDFGWLSDVEHVEMHIVQPRLDHISVATISRAELMQFGELASQAAEMALMENAPRNAGEKQCRFCKAKAHCGALYDEVAATLLSDFEDFEPPPVNTIGDDQLRRALDAKNLALAWFTAVENYVIERIANGEEFPGYKMVEGRSVRQWDESQSETFVPRLEALFGAAAYTKKLVTPTQAEKMLGKANKAAVQSFIVKPRGKPTLAPDTDPRPSIGVSISDFDIVKEETEE